LHFLTPVSRGKGESAVRFKLLGIEARAALLALADEVIE
jgi:hypothetical protein